MTRETRREHLANSIASLKDLLKETSGSLRACSASNPAIPELLRLKFDTLRDLRKLEEALLLNNG